MAETEFGIEFLRESEWLFVEHLPHGGTLQISPNGWQIEYLLSALPEKSHADSAVEYARPSMAADPIRLFIPSWQVPAIHLAWQQNFEAYEKLRDVMPAGSQMKVPGEYGMMIRLGFEPQGVAFGNDRKSIADVRELEQLLSSYEYASSRASRIINTIANAKELR